MRVIATTFLSAYHFIISDTKNQVKTITFIILEPPQEKTNPTGLVFLRLLIRSRVWVTLALDAFELVKGGHVLIAEADAKAVQISLDVLWCG